MTYISNIAINKIIENYKLSNIKGMIVASPSSSPPYQYHWVRDASIIMNVIIKHYLKTKGNNLFLMIINYIENSAQIQNLNTLTGLGEPKVNIDRTSFNDSWGRPQNDGPALRGINMIKIYKLLIDDKYINISNIVLSIITKDCNYILNNYNKICFDLWEEINGWHFYTRMVQLKFLIDCLNIDEDILKINHKSINIVINKLIEKKKQLEDANEMLRQAQKQLNAAARRLAEDKRTSSDKRPASPQDPTAEQQGILDDFNSDAENPFAQNETP